MKPRVYLDYAATTPLRDEVLDAMLPVLREGAMNPSSTHYSGRRARTYLENARRTVAEILDVANHEIYFTSGGTESNNWALRACFGSARKHLVTSRAEHHTVLETCAFLEAAGADVTYVPVRSSGAVDPAEIDKALRSDTALVSTMLVNNETGAITDIAAVADVASRRRIPVHTDAVAAAGHMSILPREMRVDMLSMAAHKFYGPVGTGVLYIREGLETRPLLYGGRQERSLRAGTENVAGAVGLAEALRLADAELLSEETRLGKLRIRLEEGLRALHRKLEIVGGEHRIPGTLLVLLPGVRSEAAIIFFDRAGFDLGAGSACNAGASRPSHVLLAAGFPNEKAACALRICTGLFTSDEDVTKFLCAAAKLLSHCEA